MKQSIKRFLQNLIYIIGTLGFIPLVILVLFHRVWFGTMNPRNQAEFMIQRFDTAWWYAAMIMCFLAVISCVVVPMSWHRHDWLWARKLWLVVWGLMIVLLLIGWFVPQLEQISWQD